MNIYLVNNGEETIIARVNEDNQVITHERFITLSSLLDDNLVIDRATIADLCGMTEMEFIRYYSTAKTITKKINGQWILTEALFTLCSPEEQEARITMMMQEKLNKLLEEIIPEEEQLESTDQERQGQIAFIREHTEWAINEAIDWAEYLNIPLDEVQIELLREEGLALAERMINDEEYIDYSYSSLKDCIEQSITCIEEDIRRR